MTLGLLNKIKKHYKQGTLCAAIIIKFRAPCTMLYYFFKTGKTHPFGDELIFVDPRKICAHMDPEQQKRLMLKTGFCFGVIANGNWDQKIKNLNFTERESYKSCYLHWVKDLSWEDTPSFQRKADLINKGGRHGLIDTIQKLKKRYHNLDLIFAHVCRQKKLSTEYNDLVTINISRDGRLIWGPDGQHRISIAIIAGLDLIPARIGFVHPKALQHLDVLHLNRLNTSEKLF